jgi:hypothetical protein
VSRPEPPINMRTYPEVKVILPSPSPHPCGALRCENYGRFLCAVGSSRQVYLCGKHKRVARERLNLSPSTGKAS